MLRQISFAPTVKSISNSTALKNYDWQLNGLNTKPIDFKDLKGKVVFVNFWATWCPPCVAEIPSIQEFYNDYQDKVVFIFETSDSWETVDQFYQKHNYDLPTYSSLSSFPDGMPKVTSIPRTFVIDKNGYIRIDKSGAADWNSESFRSEIDGVLNE